jgi:hypothetical protein
MQKNIEIGIEVSEQDDDGLVIAHVTHIDTTSPRFMTTGA